jgi:C-methyltransferase C-terminal domain/Putative zinc binding domain/Methyltransferase domain
MPHIDLIGELPQRNSAEPVQPAEPASDRTTCRACGAALQRSFLDLGMTPLANAYLSDVAAPEPKYRLHVKLCETCLLAQLSTDVSPRVLFSDYAYFSSFSESWVRHAADFAAMAARRFKLNGSSQVVEIASNDGYLLKHFKALRIPVLGIEPAANIAQAATLAGIPTEIRFFGRETAAELAGRGLEADLIVGNNVFAHVPELNDFVGGFPILLKPDGIVSLEFPHLLRLMLGVQFDTIYHEHFSYFSFLAAERVLAAHGLRVFDVKELATHGGSLRVLACHRGSARPTEDAVSAMRRVEQAAGLTRLDAYEHFADRVEQCRNSLVAFVTDAKGAGKSIVGYGAAAKGNTLLNYCGLTASEIDYVVDRSPHKQGRYLPGSRIPIHDPQRIAETQPDYLMILPWNLKKEIMNQTAALREWGGKFVIPVPEVSVVS